MADQDEDREADLERAGEADVPLGVVRAGVEVTVEASADGRLEEEEVVVDEEEDNGPALEKTIEVGGGYDREPGDGGGNDGELLEDGSAAEGVLAEAEEAIGGEGSGGDPGPEDPGPAKISPEEGIEHERDGLLDGGDGDGEDRGPLADGERGNTVEVEVEVEGRQRERGGLGEGLGREGKVFVVGSEREGERWELVREGRVGREGEGRAEEGEEGSGFGPGRRREGRREVEEASGSSHRVRGDRAGERNRDSKRAYPPRLRHMNHARLRVGF